jgi:hypothetical protein
MCKVTCEQIPSKDYETEIGLEMSGTIVVAQKQYNHEYGCYELHEIFLCKEDVSKIVEIALFNNVAPKRDFE